MSTIKSSSEDLTLNADGSNDIKFQSNGVEKASISSAGAFTSTTIDATALTGNLPAISGASLTGLPAAGDKRNYIIDGDYTQTIGGTSASYSTTDTYTILPLWYYESNGSGGTYTISQDSDVPTFAQSNHSSQYSMKVDCTVTHTPAAGEFQYLEYKITGTDYTHLYDKEVTLSFWHKHTKTGTHCAVVQSSTTGRSFVMDYTQDTTNTWEQHTQTLTLDTNDSPFAETEIGLRLIFTVATGSDYHTTADTWAGSRELGVTGMVNNGDSTSNNMLFSQISLCLGSTATFTSESIATVRDQVDYYVQRYDADSVAEECFYATPVANSTSAAYGVMPWRKKLRVDPTVTSSGSGTWELRPGTPGIGSTGVTGAFTSVYVGTSGGMLGFPVAAASLVAGGVGYMRRVGTTDAWMMVDARH